MEAHTNLDIFENGLNEQSRAYLLETTRWTKFLAIIGFILLGFALLGSLAIMLAGSMVSESMPGSSFAMLGTLGAFGLGIIYLFFIALYFYPILALFKFSTKMKRGIQTNNGELITEGFRHQKNMFKFMGILFIIIVCLYLLIGILVGINVAVRS